MILARLLKLLLIGFLVSSGVLLVVSAQDDAQAEMENAMSAAPPDIANAATIYSNSVDADGNPVVLREGTNGWACYPDWIDSPANDPACYDAVWQEVMAAMATGEEPNITEIGISYMLQGGADPSNDEPLSAPPPGEDWVISPPHIMVILPAGMDISQYGTDHHAAAPFVMWSGSPYQHLMIPVNLEAMEHE